jgi:hypothetical protein
MRNIRYISCLATLRALTCLVGYKTFTHQGIKARLPSQIQEISTANSDWNFATCFILLDDKKLISEAPFVDCPSKTDPLKRRIFLWGDSHAASLNQGLEVLYGNKFQFIQRTASSCPPLIESIYISDKCKLLNQLVLNEISNAQPDVVILMGSLSGSVGDEIGLTILKLKSIGIKNIILVGLPPKWNSSLPNIVFRKFLLTNTIHERLQNTHVLQQEKSDQELQDLATFLNVAYVSPLHILCNKLECLTRTSESSNQLLQFDQTHLTYEGSLFIATHFPKPLIQKR